MHDYNHTINDTYSRRCLVGDEWVELHVHDTDKPFEYLPEVQGILAVYSTASKVSFKKLQALTSLLADFVHKGGMVCLVGTHNDVREREVSYDDGLRMAQAIGAWYFSVNNKDIYKVKRPWDCLLGSWLRREAERAIQRDRTAANMVTMPANVGANAAYVVASTDRLAVTPTPSPSETDKRSCWKTLRRWASTCGLRKRKSKVWFN